MSALIFLHGIGTGPAAWRPQMEALAAERKVLAPNLVGRDWSSAVHETRELVAQQGPVDLCGLSLGALIALRIAAERPDDVRRLVVCAGFDRLPPATRRRVRAMAFVMRLVPAGVLRRQLAAELPEPYRAEAIEENAALRSAELSRLMRAAASFESDAAGVLTPALVLCGELDKANLPLARVLADALPNATLELVRGAGHVANLDNPEDFTALLRSFLS